LSVSTNPPEIQYAIRAIKIRNPGIGIMNLMIPHKLTNDPWKIVFIDKNIRKSGILKVFLNKSVISFFLYIKQLPIKFIYIHYQHDADREKLFNQVD